MADVHVDACLNYLANVHVDACLNYLGFVWLFIFRMFFIGYFKE